MTCISTSNLPLKMHKNWLTCLNCVSQIETTAILGGVHAYPFAILEAFKCNYNYVTILYLHLCWNVWNNMFSLMSEGHITSATQNTCLVRCYTHYLLYFTLNYTFYPF